MRVDMGVRRSRRAGIASVTPSHQYPTGVALSLDRRIALIEWGARNDAWIVEHDYDGEFRYEGQPLTALYSLDSHARVLYVGTLNKSMFVSLQIAYAVAPEEIVEPLANIRTQLDGFTPAVRQMAMSLFMDEGHFSSHLRRMRAVYGAKRVTLIEGLAPRRLPLVGGHGRAIRRVCTCLRGMKEAITCEPLGRRVRWTRVRHNSSGMSGRGRGPTRAAVDVFFDQRSVWT
jgi:hypothetical protein